MEHAKPIFASLSSGLLARKGQARPAMRSQGFAGYGSLTAAADDLGWNDMGEGAPVATLPVVAPDTMPVAPSEPEVLRQLEVLREAIEAPAPAPKPRKTKQAPRAVAPAAERVRKAAFTLRLDADRHLRLRLASAVQHRSAQQIVTEALDQFLKSIPEAEDLARRLPAAKHPLGE